MLYATDWYAMSDLELSIFLRIVIFAASISRSSIFRTCGSIGRCLRIFCASLGELKLIFVFIYIVVCISDWISMSLGTFLHSKVYKLMLNHNINPKCIISFLRTIGLTDKLWSISGMALICCAGRTIGQMFTWRSVVLSLQCIYCWRLVSNFIDTVSM